VLLTAMLFGELGAELPKPAGTEPSEAFSQVPGAFPGTKQFGVGGLLFKVNTRLPDCCACQIHGNQCGLGRGGQCGVISLEGAGAGHWSGLGRCFCTSCSVIQQQQQAWASRGSTACQLRSAGLGPPPHKTGQQCFLSCALMVQTASRFVCLLN
jgi:hypothetical protein